MEYEKLVFNCSTIEGAFDWGRSRSDLFNRFYDAEEIMDWDIAESEFKMIIKEDPEFIDAYNSLGWMHLEDYNYGLAEDYFQNAYKIGNHLIPKGFKGEIIWGIIDNRPFLRAMQGLGLTYLFKTDFNEAAKFFEKNLKYNSNDNQGIRALVIHCYLALGNWNKILKINHLFPDDVFADTIFGKLQAQFNLGKIKDAKITCKTAYKWFPLVAEELLKKKHTPIYNDDPDSLAVGSQAEAFDYWRRVGQYWTNPQLINFIKEEIESYSENCDGG